MLYVILQFLDKFIASLSLVFVCQDNSSLYNHSTYRIRNTCDGTFHYCRMSHECVLNLERTNAIA